MTEQTRAQQRRAVAEKLTALFSSDCSVINGQTEAIESALLAAEVEQRARDAERAKNQARRLLEIYKSQPLAMQEMGKIRAEALMEFAEAIVGAEYEND